MIAHEHYDFPPTFAGNPFSYGAALFSLTLICALAFAMLLQFLFEWRAVKAAQKIAANKVSRPIPLNSPLSVHRMIISGFLITILLGALPDVLVLYFWGEASERTMDSLFFMDRFGDALTVIPFSMAAMLSAWGLQVLPQQLVRETRVTMLMPKWQTVRPHFRIAAVVFVIAMGVTFAKAGA